MCGGAGPSTSLTMMYWKILPVSLGRPHLVAELLVTVGQKDH